MQHPQTNQKSKAGDEQYEVQASKEYLLTGTATTPHVQFSVPAPHNHLKTEKRQYTFNYL
jgi:hypothetical protein